MVNIMRVRAEWSGFLGGPGVNTFYCMDPVTFLPQLRSFYNSLSGSIQSGTHIAIENSGDTIEVETGDLVGTWTASTVPVMDGTGTGGIVGPCGAVVNWLTGSVINNHRLRGRTFMVPLTVGSFAADGTLTDAYRTSITSVATALVTAAASNFVVWSRPRVATGDKPARVGGSAVVTSVRVPDLAAVLRSRRD